MADWPHWIVIPVVLPLVTGALLLLFERAPAVWVASLSVLSTVASLALALGLTARASDSGVQAYILGNWPAPFGIALALDRLSALMLLLTAVVALASLVYALGGDAGRGAHFHVLFQLQLMGLNGAFLTADLFNLFVFFEVLLAASYGLLLHGDRDGRRARLRAALHYVSFNLAGSALFLVAASLLYGLAGTLNLADLALKLPQLAAEDGALVQAAALMLLVVFALKAALLPLYFWLPETYGAASAPVAALFAIMTKVGVYAVLRLTTLVFGAEGGAAALVATPALPVLALATLALAAAGALAATRLRALVAYLVVGSAGTLLLAVGLATSATVAAGLFYLVNSTLVAAVWFLLADRIRAARDGSDALQPMALRAGWAPLAIGFAVAAVAATGMPPLAGFFGKALLLQSAGATPFAAWVFALVLGSSLALLLTMARAGSVLFWSPAPPSLGVMRTAAPAGPVHPAVPAHGVAIVSLFACLVGAAAAAGPIAAYADATAAQLFERQGYIAAVLGAQPVAPAFDVRREMRERGESKP